MPDPRKPMDARDALEFVAQATRRSARQEELSKALWELTPEERVAAMRAGVLTFGQLCEWARRRPDEVPLVGNEFEFIAVKTPEWAEARDRGAHGPTAR